MIWLVGAGGLLGQELTKLFTEKNIEYVASYSDIDISKIENLERFHKEHFNRLNYIINCAAYTQVDNAEKFSQLAYNTNSLGAENLAQIAQRVGATLIHISTDYVFDGQKEEDYRETDLTSPLSIYGKSKQQGEQKIIATTTRYFIIRTSWLYGFSGNNFVNTMIRLLQEKDEIKIVHDQWGSPTWTRDLSEFIWHFLHAQATNYGVYHFSSEGKISWYQLVCFLKETLQYNTSLKAITSEDFPTLAKRPKNSYLSKNKIRQNFSFEVPCWKTSLRKYLQSIDQSLL